jgi:hypothetical protein
MTIRQLSAQANFSYNDRVNWKKRASCQELSLPICQCGSMNQGHRISVTDLAMSRVCQALPCMQQLSALDLEEVDVNK